MDQKLEIGVVGAGAIGGVMSLFLSRAGYNVELTKQSENDLVIDNRVNLEVRGAFGDYSYLVPYVQNNNFTTQKDIIFIFTKAFSVKNAVQSVMKYLTPNGVVVTIQNVLNIDEVCKVVPSEKLVSLVIDWASTRVSSNEMFVGTKGGMHIGTINPAAKIYLPILKQVLDAVAPTIIEDDMLSFISSRFILNNNISCLGALTGYDLGTVLREKQGKRLFIELIREQLEVFEKHDIKVLPYNGQLDYHKFVENNVAGILYRGTMFKRIINLNGKTVSSTLRALEKKKQTELDYLMKKVSTMAADKNISAPYITQLAIILDEISAGERSIIIENLYDERLVNPKKMEKKNVN